MFRKRPQSKLGRGKRTLQVGKGPPRSPLPTGGADYWPCGRRANPRGAGMEVVTLSRDGTCNRNGGHRDAPRPVSVDPAAARAAIAVCWPPPPSLSSRSHLGLSPVWRRSP